MKFSLKKFLLAATLLSVSASTMAKQITDIAGRKVDIPDHVKTMVLGEGRMVYALSMLEPNPLKGVVAWRTDLIKNDPDTYQKLLAKFPDIKNIPDLGNPYSSDVNLETIISMKPDVYLLNVGNLLKAQESGLIDKLARVGIPTVFVDFRQKPLEDTVPSMRILGEVVNQQAKAEKFIQYYQKQMNMVKDRVAKIPEKDRPLVFIENAAGLDGDECCTTYGNKNFGRFVDYAGGRNWGSTKSTNLKFKVNPEVIFSEPFDYIIATGANWKAAYKGSTPITLGYFAKPAEIQQEMQYLANRDGWSSLKAIKDKHFYAIYHQFYNSPYHFMAILAFAKWFHPQQFADVDLQKTYQQFYTEFMPISLTGEFWAKYQ